MFSYFYKQAEPTFNPAEFWERVLPKDKKHLRNYLTSEINDGFYYSIVDSYTLTSADRLLTDAGVALQRWLRENPDA